MKKHFTIASVLLIAFIPACKKTEVGPAASSMPAKEHNAENDQATPRRDENALSLKSAMSPLTGRWTGKDDIGQDIEWSFQGMNTMTISVGNESGSGTYHADYSQNPPNLAVDFGDRGVVKTIFEVVSDISLRLENNNPGEPLPTAFTEKAIVFTRRQ